MYGFFLPVLQYHDHDHDHYQYQYLYYILKTTETKDHIGKLWVEVIIFLLLFLVTVATVDSLASSNKLRNNYREWHILSLVGPLESASKIGGYREYSLVTKQCSPPVCIVHTNPDIVGSLDLLK